MTSQNRLRDMRGFRLLVSVGIAMVFWGHVGLSQESDESADARLARLERRVDLLEKRLAQQGTIAAGADSIDLGNPAEKRNWKALKVGMTEAEVLALLGEPTRRQSLSSLTYWYFDVGPAYIKPHVSFDNHRLYGWSAP